MKLKVSELPILALNSLKRLGRYRVFLFIVFIVLLYAYLIFQINQASGVQPSADQQATSTKASPRIDPAVVQQLQQLQDNSVSVNALFNGTRTNPFQ